MRTQLAAWAGAATLLAVGGCGQKGALFLPREPAAANRATLPQVVRSALPDSGGGSSSSSSNRPVPALPAPPADVVAPTPEADLPAPYSPLTPPDSVPAAFP